MNKKDSIDRSYYYPYGGKACLHSIHTSKLNLMANIQVFHGEPVKVKVWFAPEVAGYIKEKIWHESQIITDQKDGSIYFEAEVAGIFEIKTWIMGWGAKAKVLEPESLKKSIISEIDSLQQLYIQQNKA